MRVGMVLFLMMVGVGVCGELKVGTVDVGKVIAAHPQTEANAKVVEREVEDFESERMEMLAKFNKMKDDFDTVREEARNKALSEVTREEKLELAERKLIALREYEQKVREKTYLRQKQVADQRLRMGMRVVSDVDERIEKYAEENKFDLILDSSGRGMNGVETVIYSRKTIDVTEDILKLIVKEPGS